MTITLKELFEERKKFDGRFSHEFREIVVKACQHYSSKQIIACIGIHPRTLQKWQVGLKTRPVAGNKSTHTIQFAESSQTYPISNPTSNNQKEVESLLPTSSSHVSIQISHPNGKKIAISLPDCSHSVASVFDILRQELIYGGSVR